MDSLSVPDLVRTYITLSTRPSSQGWYPVLCKVCNDHGRKGPRGAFMFENDGVAYHCFNCKDDEGKATYDPSRHNSITKKFEHILQCFGVPQEEINKTKLALLGSTQQKAKKEKDRVAKYEPEEIQLPTHFKTLDYDSLWCEVAREYLLERMIDPDSYPFMISTGVCEDLEGHPKKVQLGMISQAEKWPGRVIVPIYKDEKLIFYIGRDMTDSKKKKYESPSVPRNNVLFGFDKLFEDTTKPLYVVEGIFDAMVIGGVAILGNKLHDNQIYWLNRSNRQKVYIPDKFGDGHVTAERAVKLGWSVAFPDVGACKDVNAAVQKYGKLYVTSSIIKETVSGLAAQNRIGHYCK